MISMNWVKDYIDIKDENLEELADKVTKAGINVEHVIKTNIDNSCIPFISIKANTCYSTCITI